MKKITPFAQKVYQLTKKIPKGKVTTYKALAQALNTKAYRAVGQVLKKNPFAPQVPCHRVIRSNGTIGGFNGKSSGKNIQKKINLLKKEGVKFFGKKVKNFNKSYFSFKNLL
jgi:methylated-DNA-[protein]-cysteine S-methyltransferase